MQCLDRANDALKKWPRKQFAQYVTGFAEDLLSDVLE